MRIAFLVPSPPALANASFGPASGGYLYDERMASGLRARGNHVVLIWTTNPASQADAEHLALRLCSERYDVVLEDELGFEEYAAVNAHLRERGAAPSLVGLIHVPTALLEPERTSADAERRFLAMLDAAVYVSRTVHVDSERVLGARIPSHVVPPGADTPPVQAPPARRPGTKQPIQLICVGHFLPHKGYLELVDVLQRLADDPRTPAWSASWVGDLDLAPTYRDAVRSRLHQSSLVSRVRLTGRLPPHEVARALASADLFVTASRYESHGFAVAEALAVGVPVVGWTAGGLWEYLRPGRDSIRLSWGETDRFAATLRHLMADDGLRAALAQGALESARTFASWPQRAAELEAVLDSVLALRREGSRHAAG